ncbi:hypothetical protein [Crossiella equi]|uniref:hypothetical protein n=1 Tax=Crossiella equi TaxID=130796 RepID=UPI001AE2E0A8|nr:hypothetical protein [Crossiella equi]
MTSAGVVRSWGERLRVASLRLAAAGGLAAVAWLAGAAVAHADEAPAPTDLLSPSSATGSVTQADDLGERIKERTLAKLGREPVSTLTTLVTEDADEDGTRTTEPDEVLTPSPDSTGGSTTVNRATRRSTGGSASAVRPVPPPAPAPPPAVELPAPAPAPVVEPEPEIAPGPPARPVATVRTAVPQLVEPPAPDRGVDRDVDLPTHEPRHPTPSAPGNNASTGGSGSISDNGGARGATAMVTTGLPQLPKPSLVTVEHPRNAGSTHNTPGLPPTSPD